VVVDVGLLEVLAFRVGVGLVGVLDAGVVVLVLVPGELVLPGVAVAQVVGHVQVLVMVDGGVVPVLVHGLRLLG
jgi:membrane protein DedA with SNARE-associated domain